MSPIINGLGLGPCFSSGDGVEETIDSPLELSNLVLWLDGDDEDIFAFSSGVLVSQWGDKSGNADHVVQADTGKQPDYDSANGRVTFNGITDWLQSSGAFTGGSISTSTIAVVFEATSPQGSINATDAIFDGRTATNRMSLFAGRENAPPLLNQIHNGGSFPGGPTINTNLHIYIIDYDTLDEMFYDGGAAVISEDAGTETIDGVTLCNVPGSSTNFGTGHMHEFIVYDGAKSDADKNLLGNYLADKWGLIWVDIGSGYQPDIPGQKGRNHAGSGVTKISGKVSNWTDSSGNGNDLFQLTASKRPIFTDSDADFNDLPVISFDGVDDLLVTNTFSGGAMSHPNTIFLVARWDTNNSRYMMDGIDSANRAGFQEFTSNNSLVITILREYAGVDTDAHIFVIEWNDTASKLLVDGGAAAAGNAGNHSLTGITLGAKYDGTAPGEITVAELIVYDGLLSFTDQDTIGNELATRYDLTWTNRS